MKVLLRVFAVVIISLVLCSTLVLGQDVWRLPLSGSSASVEYLSPSIKTNLFSGLNGFLGIVNFNPSISMYSIVATGNFQLHNGNRLIVEIPYVHYHMDGSQVTMNYSEGTYTYTVPATNSGNIGNIYVAYDIAGKKDEHFSTTLGIYLPTASDKEEAPVIGTAYDYDQFALYVPNLLTLHPQFNYHSESENGFVKIQGSPTFTFLTKSEPGEHTLDMFLALSLQAGFFIGDFTLGAGWAENFVATESGSFSDRFIDQAGVMAGYKIGKFNPEIFFRFPLSKNISDEINSVLGVNVAFEF